MASVKHAGPAALERLCDLLQQIRDRGDVKERKIGIFYWKSKAFLHFHEDRAGLFADLSRERDFDRYRVNTREEREVLLAAIDRALKTGRK